MLFYQNAVNDKIPSSWKLVASICLQLLLPWHHKHLGHHIQVRGSVHTPKKSKKVRNNTGFYYGIRDDIFFPTRHQRPGSDEENNNEQNLALKPLGAVQFFSSFKQKSRNPKKSSSINPTRQLDSTITTTTITALEDILGETLLELREMREDIATLREEMISMKHEITQSKVLREVEAEEGRNDELLTPDEERSYLRNNDYTKSSLQSVRDENRKQKKYHMIGSEVEKWAQSLLDEQESEHSGWKEVKCNSIMAKKINKFGQTRCFIKVRKSTER